MYKPSTVSARICRKSKVSNCGIKASNCGIMVEAIVETSEILWNAGIVTGAGQARSEDRVAALGALPRFRMRATKLLVVNAAPPAEPGP